MWQFLITQTPAWRVQTRERRGNFMSERLVNGNDDMRLSNYNSCLNLNEQFWIIRFGDLKSSLWRGVWMVLSGIIWNLVVLLEALFWLGAVPILCYLALAACIFHLFEDKNFSLLNLLSEYCLKSLGYCMSKGGKGRQFQSSALCLCKSTEIYLCFCACNGYVKYIVPVVIGLMDDWHYCSLCTL